MTETERYSTAGIEAPLRLAYWNRIGNEVYGRLWVEPQAGAPFDAALSRRAYGSSWLTRVFTTPATVKGESWGRSSRDPEHAFVLLQERGTTLQEQQGRQVRLGEGDFTLLTEPQPFEIAFSENTCLLVLKLPYDQLGARIGEPSRHAAELVPAARAALLANFLRTLADQEDVSQEPGWSEAAGDVMFDLLALSYWQPNPREKRADLGARWQRSVRELVDDNLQDSELGAAWLARRLGVSPRYVQMVFAGMATTASAYILAQRLDRAAQLLAARRSSVAEVAFGVGFSDLSYFYRTFRKRFGTSPGRRRTP